MKPEDLKLLVKEKYSEIALQSKEQNESSCCGATGCCSTVDYSIFSESYSHLGGYVADADLGLGCGLPTEFALIKEGDTVIDLGSGAGNDCFVARSLTGESGEVIGIDMTEAMIEKARENTRKLGFTNVSFRLGDIEKMPVTANKADVVISNCVLNLVPDKQKAFSEIYRVLKPGGHLSVSDVVVKGQLPAQIREAAELYAGCVSGAIEMDEYLNIMASSCLTNIKVQKEKQVNVPDEILSDYLDTQALEAFKKSGTGIFSITVYAEKPANDCGCSSC
jgi:ubiquinone/menaquinone biosynthesis C-methylase UbiE